MKKKVDCGERNFTSAFTLVEMLVALAVFSIIAITVSSVFRSGVRTWRAGNEWSEENQVARNVFRSISKELVNSVNYAPEMPFNGGEQRISFMTLLESHDAKQGTLRELKRVAYRYDAEEKTLKRFEAGKEEGFDIRKAREALIADGVESMNFSYAFKPVYEGEGYRWKSAWKDEKEIPRGVRIRMADFHTIVFIPVGTLGDESAFIQ